MSTLERLCSDSEGFLRDIEYRLSQYEQVGEDFLLNIEADTNEVMRRLSGNLERMDILVDKEPFPRRQNSKLRVDQIKYDLQHLQSAFRGLQARRAQRIQEQRHREELLATNFSENSNGHTSINVDAHLRHHTSMRNVNRNMDDLLNHGQEILTNLRTQRISLKGIRGRVSDIASKLGLSTTVMKMIERRGAEDRYLLYGGMVVCTCLMLAIYWFLV